MNEAENVQQHDAANQTEADTVVSDTDAPAESDVIAETVADEGVAESQEPDALKPGGKRWNQLYARTKTAEGEAQRLREEKARLEGQLEATRTAPPVAETKVEPRYTWEQLEAGIEEGKWDLAKARAYDRETLRQEMEARVDAKVNTILTTQSRGNTIQSDIAQYKTSVPGIITAGSPERVKVEQEFAYLVNSLGYDQKDPRTELLACRNVFGDVKTAQTRQAARITIPERETMQDMPTTGKPKVDAKDPLKSLTGEQRKHYQRMIDKGVYAKGWADVRDELKEYA